MPKSYSTISRTELPCMVRYIIAYLLRSLEAPRLAGAHT